MKTTPTCSSLSLLASSASFRSLSASRLALKISAFRSSSSAWRRSASFWALDFFFGPTAERTKKRRVLSYDRVSKNGRRVQAGI